VADVRFYPEAQAEYDTALAWYPSRSPRAADRFEAEVERLVGLIGATPELYPEYDDEHRYAVLRRLPYSLVYQILPAHVLVVALAHSGRAPGYWQGRS
jgi:plasmid stabilization system protein ParE